MSPEEIAQKILYHRSTNNGGTTKNVIEAFSKGHYYSDSGFNTGLIDLVYGVIQGGMFEYLNVFLVNSDGGVKRFHIISNGQKPIMFPAWDWQYVHPYNNITDRYKEMLSLNELAKKHKGFLLIHS